MFAITAVVEVVVGGSLCDVLVTATVGVKPEQKEGNKIR